MNKHSINLNIYSMKKILLSIVAFMAICSSAFAGDGTKENPYTMTEMAALASQLESKAVSEESVYMIGIATNIVDISTSYGNATFWMADEEGSDKTFEVYRCYGFENEKITDATIVEKNDTVLIYGQYTNYNGTYETAQGKAYIIEVKKKQGNTPEVDITNTPETAYSVTKALELIAAGEGLSQKVYVKGEVLPDGLNVDINYGNATYTISDGTSNLLIYRGYYFGGNKFTSEDQLQDGDEVIVYGQLVDYNGTCEMTTGSQIYSKNGKTSEDVAPYTLEGEGTKEKPYTVADVKNLFNDAANTPAEAVWVKGTILGNVNTSTGATVVPDVFTDVNGDGKVDNNDCAEGETVAVATNLSVGDATGSNLAVQLPAGDVRAALNILDNPGNLGKEVAVYGLIQKYCGVAGVKSVTDFVLDGVDGISNINDNVNDDDNIYNIAGQRVGNGYKGIVVKNGRKYMK